MRAVERVQESVSRWIELVLAAASSDSGSCIEWPWGEGYATVRLAHTSILVHRLTLEIRLGQALGDDVVVRHTCDNPPCINGAHQLVGTQADNVADMHSRGRIDWEKWRKANAAAALLRRGEAHPRAKLTNEQVSEVRARLAAGMPGVEVAAAYGVSTALVSMLKNNKLRAEGSLATLTSEAG